ncbi:hypothetical protein JI742_08665 [Piscinibacter sp. Jin2]|uniref:4Fe-4S ferredoxin-type domain-containing protein n=1 Tax=Aquariibacter lacus TaxID=2801332 RepID=A0A9X0XHZ7_9BURK|nr:hypothetical protein [Piscinibacter lacus]
MPGALPPRPPEPLQRVLWLAVEPGAPAKPAEGEACNGCGLCCLAEPCPVGRLLSRRRQGACVALRWDGAAGHYRCGALTRFRHPLWRRLIGRWIAAGAGCDASFETGERLGPPG